MKERILVVDDEAELREALKDILEGDYEVMTCGDGMEALEWVRNGENAVNLVITDLRMPGVDGYELLIKMKEKSPSVSVIMMSVYFADDPELTREIRKRADELVRKPFNLLEMKRLVDKLLGRTDRKSGEGVSVDGISFGATECVGVIKGLNEQKGRRPWLIRVQAESFAGPDGCPCLS
jgi:DNA-binding NtrC family response regulator